MYFELRFQCDLDVTATNNKSNEKKRNFHSIVYLYRKNHYVITQREKETNSKTKSHTILLSKGQQKINHKSTCMCVSYFDRTCVQFNTFKSETEKQQKLLLYLMSKCHCQSANTFHVCR